MKAPAAMLGRASGSADLDRLLDPASALALFREAGLEVSAADRLSVRLKPGDAAILAFRFRPSAVQDATDGLLGYVRISPDDRARVLADKWSRLKPRSTVLGSGVRLLPGGRSVLFLFPNDAALRGLRFVADKDTLKRTLAPLACVGGRGFRIQARKSSLEVVRYKPERRFIAKLVLGLKSAATGEKETLRAFLRFFPDGRGAVLDDLAGHLRTSCPGILVPEPFGALAGGRLQVEEAVEGEALLPRIVAGDAPVGHVAGSLAAIHAAPAVSWLPARAPAAALRDALTTASTLASLAPELAPGLGVILRRMDGMIPHATPAVIHGDFHFHQVLLSKDGPVIVDFERAAVGDPFEDVGNFVAHVAALGLQTPAASGRAERCEEEFVAHYLAASGPRGRDRATADLEFFVAAGLVRLAFLPYRRGESDWAGKAAALVGLAALRLDRTLVARRAPTLPPFFGTAVAAGERGATWEVLHPRKDGPWPGFLLAADGKTCLHGVYDPEADRFQRVLPADDPALAHGRPWLERGELVSCRIGHRATVRLATDCGPVYVKVLSPSKTRRLLARHRAVEVLCSSGPDFPRFAPVVEVRSPEGILVLGGLAGLSLHDELMSGGDGTAVAAAARALAQFQAAPPGSVSLPPAPIAPDLALLHAFAGRRGAAPAVDWRGALDALPDAPAREGRVSLVHGDFHDRNILVDGERVSFLDLDLLHAGDPAEDVGNVAAHFVLRALQRGDPARMGHDTAARFFEAWRRSGGCVPAAAVDAVMRRTLFRLACLYTFRRRWRGLVPVLLEQVRR